ncbi:MAG TPA: hypothetical protein VH436_12640 [Vicinamibacterales bacterium]
MNAVKSEIGSWIEKSPYTCVRQTNSDGTRHSSVVRVTHQPDFRQWSLMTGDAFHNLRSGLDHLIYAVAIHEIDSTALPGLLKTFAFPICDTAHDFKSKFWRIAPLSDPVRTLIESLQPYNRPHPTFPPLLAVLRDFDDIDKHRLLQLAIAQLIEGEIAKISAVIPPGEQMTVLSHVGEVVDGTEILVIIPASSDARYALLLQSKSWDLAPTRHGSARQQAQRSPLPVQHAA